MHRGAITLALLIASLGSRQAVQAQLFSPHEYGQQAAAVDRLVWSEEPSGPIKPYISPLETVYVSVDATALVRDGGSNVTVATLTNALIPVLTTESYDFSNQPGLRALAGVRINPNFAVEATYQGLAQWDDLQSVQDFSANSQGTTGNLHSPFTNFGNPVAVGFDFNHFVSARTITDLDSYEFNLRQRLDMPYSTAQASALYGLRYIGLDDEFQYRSRSFSPAPGGAAVAVDVAAQNRMYGGQLGGTLELHIERRAWLTFEAKGMLLYNDADRQYAQTVGPLGGIGVLTSNELSEGRMALAGELQTFLIFKVTPALIVRVGYQALLFDGLALGSENFAKNAPVTNLGVAAFEQDGNVVFHGPFAGLTGTW